MDVQIQKKGDLLREMTITVPAADVEKAFNTRLEAVAKTVKMDGFRPGKVPMDVVKKRHGQHVMQDVAGELIGQSIDQAFQNTEEKPAGQPKVDSKELPEVGKDFTITVSFEVFPDVEPKKYEGMAIEKPVAEVSDKMINDVLDRLKAGNKSFSEKDGKAEKGDRVTIDAQGYLAADDSEIAGSNLNNHKVVLGSNMLIPGFEEALDGMKKGDEKTFDITFPTPYHSKDLEGAPAKFSVKIHTVEGSEEVALDDAFAANFGAESVEDLKSKISEQLTKDVENAAEMKMKKEMFDKLCAENKDFVVPEVLVEAEMGGLLQAQMQELRQRGLGIEALGKTEDELKVELKELSERRVRLGILLSAIAKKHSIDVEKADIEAEVAKIAEAYGPQAEQVKAYYAKPENQQAIAGPLFEKKVVNWLVDNGKVKEVKIDAEELMESMQ